MTRAPVIPSTRKLTIRVEHPIGSMVYLKADDEPRRGMVTGIMLRPIGPTYQVTWSGGEERGHFACELGAVPDDQADDEADATEAETD